MTEAEVKAQVVIGGDAEDFCESELGKVILGMAQQDRDDAVARMAIVNLSDVSKAVEAQVELRTAMRFEQYLRELITRGQEVFEAYKQQKQEG